MILKTRFKSSFNKTEQQNTYINFIFLDIHL